METRNYTSAKDPLNFDADPDPGHLFFFFLLTSVQHLEFRSFLIISLIFNSSVLSFKTRFLSQDPGSQNIVDPTDTDPKH